MIAQAMAYLNSHSAMPATPNTGPSSTSYHSSGPLPVPPQSRHLGPSRPDSSDTCVNSSSAKRTRPEQPPHLEVDSSCGICTGFIKVGEYAVVRKFLFPRPFQ